MEVLSDINNTLIDNAKKLLYNTKKTKSIVSFEVFKQEILLVYYTIITQLFCYHRAAMKMANIDAVFEYNFTYPKTSDGVGLLLLVLLTHHTVLYLIQQPAVTGTDLLYFADICAGPGGFSEYVLWRRKWHAKGFGLTLRSVSQMSKKLFVYLCASQIPKMVLTSNWMNSMLHHQKHLSLTMVNVLIVVFSFGCCKCSLICACRQRGN